MLLFDMLTMATSAKSSQQSYSTIFVHGVVEDSIADEAIVVVTSFPEDIGTGLARIRMKGKYLFHKSPMCVIIFVNFILG